MTDPTKPDAKVSGDNVADNETGADPTALTDAQVDAVTGGGDIVITKTTDKASTNPS